MIGNTTYKIFFIVNTFNNIIWKSIIYLYNNKKINREILTLSQISPHSVFSFIKSCLNLEKCYTKRMAVFLELTQIISIIMMYKI